MITDNGRQYLDVHGADGIYRLGLCQAQFGAVAELPALIGQVHTALTRVSSGHGEALANALRPAISIKKSIAPDYIVCLEDGKKFKSLKRHLRTHYNLTPEQYREKWSLGSDYPMVAPNYAAARSRLAKQMRLGQKRPRHK